MACFTELISFEFVAIDLATGVQESLGEVAPCWVRLLD